MTTCSRGTIGYGKEPGDVLQLAMHHLTQAIEDQTQLSEALRVMKEKLRVSYLQADRRSSFQDSSGLIRVPAPFFRL